MTIFDWNEEKNAELKRGRGVGFEDVVTAFREKGVIDIIDHPNQAKYKGQKIMFVVINEYVHAVPYVQEGERVFLKTIYPSRQANKKYAQRG